MVKTVLLMQGVQVQSLVGELRSHIAHAVAKKKKKKQRKEKLEGTQEC